MHALSSKRTHFIYSDSGLGALKRAASALRGDSLGLRVAYGDGEQAFLGPLDLIARPSERREWLTNYAPRATDWMGVEASRTSAHDVAMTQWWETARTMKGPKTVWHCSRDAGDASFLLALSSEAHLEDDTLLVDIASMDFVAGDVTSTGECSPEQMLKAGDHAVPIDAELIKGLHDRYDKLGPSQGGLRRLDAAGVLRTAALDSHDVTIRKFISEDWRPCQSVMTDIWKHEKSRRVREMEFGFILWRIEIMIAAGDVERRGGSSRPPFEEDPTMGDLRLSP
jgi:hypothetical protein